MGYWLAAAKKGSVKFSWDPTQGSNCMTFCSGAVKAVTGIDFHEQLVGDTYTNAVGAYKAIRKLRAGSIDQLLGSLFEEADDYQMRAGDLCTIKVHMDGEAYLEDQDLVPNHDMRAGAVCAPPYFYCITPKGLGVGNLKDASGFFLVGK
jgi:hypothetical protein